MPSPSAPLQHGNGSKRKANGGDGLAAAGPEAKWLRAEMRRPQRLVSFPIPVSCFAPSLLCPWLSDIPSLRLGFPTSGRSDSRRASPSRPRTASGATRCSTAAAGASTPFRYGPGMSAWKETPYIRAGSRGEPSRAPSRGEGYREARNRLGVRQIGEGPEGFRDGSSGALVLRGD